MLFAGGAFGVWELDSRLDLRQVRCSPARATAVLLLECCASHLQGELTGSIVEGGTKPCRLLDCGTWCECSVICVCRDQ